MNNKHNSSGTTATKMQNKAKDAKTFENMQKTLRNIEKNTIFPRDKKRKKKPDQEKTRNQLKNKNTHWHSKNNGQ